MLGAGRFVVPTPLLLMETCASSGACCNMAEPSWLPPAAVLTIGASGDTDPETPTDAVDASVVGVVLVANGVVTLVASIDTSTGGWSGAACCVAGTLLEGLDESDLIDVGEAALRNRRDCVATFCSDDGAGSVVAVDHPSSVLVAAVLGAAAGSVDAASVELEGGGAGCAPGRVGIRGGVPIESSYEGRFGSLGGLFGAGRVTYALVTTGIRTPAPRRREALVLPDEGWACRPSSDGAAGLVRGLRVTAGTRSEGNARLGVDRTRRGEIVFGAAARVAATGTTYEIVRENAPIPTSQSATLRLRSASRLKRSAASELAFGPTTVIPNSPSPRWPPSGPRQNAACHSPCWPSIGRTAYLSK